MKHLVRYSVVVVVLFGSTASAFAHVTGGDPRPRTTATQPTTVWGTILAALGISGS